MLYLELQQKRSQYRYQLSSDLSHFLLSSFRAFDTTETTMGLYCRLLLFVWLLIMTPKRSANIYLSMFFLSRYCSCLFFFFFLFFSFSFFAFFWS
ncbi:hypothetical protein GGR50DRAFT_681052 [Xylaria sp. CBS 124048]|nr:hypothetical protein GGR50DRAFT_681052 [Xylaria sp. CBS 124048]